MIREHSSTQTLQLHTGDDTLLRTHRVHVDWFERLCPLRQGLRWLRLLPYRNDSRGVEMQVAAGIYGGVEDFRGGVKITVPWSIGP